MKGAGEQRCRGENQATPSLRGAKLSLSRASRSAAEPALTLSGAKGEWEGKQFLTT